MDFLPEWIPEEAVQIFLAAFIGGVIGAEREYRDKSAGFRTMIFICIGATLFMIVSRMIGGPEDPGRIAANIVSGIGFLGAGAIIRHGTRTKGLTTATTIWLTAALGMAIGGECYELAFMGTAAVLIVLWLFPYIERWIGSMRESRSYEVVCLAGNGKFDSLEAMFKSHGLRVRAHKQMKSGDRVTFEWLIHGSPKNHERAMRVLFADDEIESFTF